MTVTPTSPSGQILTMVLEEYKTLRTEVISAVDRQHSVTYWGVSGVALIVAALASSWDRLHRFPNLVVAIIMWVIPAVVTMYVVTWIHVIAKISSIGWYLHHIEEKVARLVRVSEIRQAYDLPPDAPVEPFRYLIGWEHRLWRQSSQTAIERSIRLVKAALAVGYLAVLWVALYVGADMHQVELVRFALRPAGIAAALFWIVAWFALANFLDRITAVGERMRLGPRSSTDDVESES